MNHLLSPYVLRRHISAPSHKAGGNTSHDAERRYIPSNNRAGADDAAFADRNAGQDYGICTDIRASLDRHASDLEFSLDDGYFDRQSSVNRAQHFSARPPTDVILYHELTCIKIALRSNPHVVSNHTVPVETALYVCLSAYENSASNLERFCVFEAHTTSDSNAVTKTACH